MRRVLLQEPMARPAAWSPRLALFALLLAGVAIFAARWSRLEPAAALIVFAAALVFAAAGALAAASAYGAIWREGASGIGRATLGLALALGLLGPPMALAVVAARLPPLSDVATDAVDPPAFSRSARATAARAAEPPGDPGVTARQTARRAYAELVPLVLDVEPEQAFRMAQKVARRMRWSVIEERPPGGRLGRAQIDAIDRTTFFGFPVDVVIRLTPLVGQTRVDYRAAARVGRHDLGAGARRWAAFAAELQAEADAR